MEFSILVFFSRKIKTLIFQYWGGQVRFPRILVQGFDFKINAPNILKEAGNYFLFEVLAKLGDYKHNKYITKYLLILMETFPKL